MAAKTAGIVLTVEIEKSAGSASQDVHPDRDVPFNFYIL